MDTHSAKINFFISSPSNCKKVSTLQNRASESCPSNWFCFAPASGQPRLYHLLSAPVLAGPQQNRRPPRKGCLRAEAKLRHRTTASQTQNFAPFGKSRCTLLPIIRSPYTCQIKFCKRKFFFYAPGFRSNKRLSGIHGPSAVSNRPNNRQ